MKLNNKRTILVGLAFLSICSFWQMYDNIVPLILTRTFHMNETLSGAIMAADNILALFLLPIFGGISDEDIDELNNVLKQARTLLEKYFPLPENE